MKNKIPVWDGKQIVGYTTASGYRRAAIMLGCVSVQLSRVKTPDERVCWVRVPWRSATLAA